MQSIRYVIIDSKGHQPEFDRFFHALLPKLNFTLSAETLRLRSLFVSDTIFCSWLDRSPMSTAAFLLMAVGRALLGHKTVALFFRPNACFYPKSLVSFVSRLVFKFLSRWKKICLLSIVPYDVYPLGQQVTADWIYDPQLWDIQTLGIPNEDESVSEIQSLLKHVQGRKIVVSLGRQDRSKGFDYFSSIWCASEQVRKEFIFVAAGKVCPKSQAAAQHFKEKGGILIDQRISDAALFYLYSQAALVWSCYGANYNQSSGIHGRAVQLGIPVIVREGSFIDKLGQILDLASLAVPDEDPLSTANLLLQGGPSRKTEAQTLALSQKMHEYSCKVLAQALTR